MAIDRMPVISPIILENVEHEFDSNPNWVESMLKRIDSENLGYATFISKVLKNEENEKARAAAVASLIIAYRLFEVQIEVNQLEGKNENP